VFIGCGCGFTTLGGELSVGAVLVLAALLDASAGASLLALAPVAVGSLAEPVVPALLSLLGAVQAPAAPSAKLSPNALLKHGPSAMLGLSRRPQ
jgi:hypothetical protein